MTRDKYTLSFQILSNTKALLGYWDKNMVCRFANQAYKEWLGIKPEDIVNKTTLQQFLGASYPTHLPFIKNVLSGKTQTFQRDFKLPAGGIRHAVVSYTPDIVDNVVEGFYIHAADISTQNEKTIPGTFSNRDHAFETIKTLQLNLLSKFPGIDQLAKNEGISASKLKSDFREKTGQNLFAYYRRLQMDFAYTYLHENRCNRKQMADLLNFANPSNFSVCYNNYLKEREAGSQIESLSKISEERYRIFTEQAPLAIAMLDNDLRVLAVSKKWIAADPLQQREVFGKKVFELYKGLNPKWNSIFEEALQGKHVFSDEDYLLSRNEMRYMKWDFSPWHHSSGDIGGVIVYIKDLTESKKAEDEKKKIQRILEETSKTAKIGVWEYDSNTKTEFWSNTAKEILGLTTNDNFSFKQLRNFCTSKKDKDKLVSLINNNEKALSVEITLKIRTFWSEIKNIKLIAIRHDGNPIISGLIREIDAILTPSQKATSTGIN